AEVAATDADSDHPAIPADPGGPQEAKGPCCWVQADYLLWWLKPAPVFGPLVTTGSLAVPFSGALGIAGTTVRRDQDPIEYGSFSGIRVFVGTWAGDRDIGFEAGGFLLERQSKQMLFPSDVLGNPVSGIPFFNTQLGVEDFADHSVPNATAGRAEFRSS